MDEPRAPKHWWETMPGILAGIAAIITAVSGILAIYVNRTKPPEKSTTSPRVSGSSTVATALPPNDILAPANASAPKTPSGNEQPVDLRQRKLTGEPGQAVRIGDEAKIAPSAPHKKDGRFIEHVATARALLRVRKYAEACRMFETALALAPPSAIIDVSEISAAREQYQQNNFAEAAQHFEKAFGAIPP